MLAFVRLEFVGACLKHLPSWTALTARHLRGLDYIVGAPMSLQVHTALPVLYVVQTCDIFEKGWCERATKKRRTIYGRFSYGPEDGAPKVVAFPAGSRPPPQSFGSSAWVGFAGTQ